MTKYSVAITLPGMGFLIQSSTFIELSWFKIPKNRILSVK